MCRCVCPRDSTFTTRCAQRASASLLVFRSRGSEPDWQALRASAEIARELESGIGGKSPGGDYEIVIDRRSAIRRAIELAQPGDCLLLAGKRHERSMLTGSGAEPWDERAEAESAIRERLAAS